MKKSFKIMLGIGGAVLALIVTGGAYFWYLMGQPLYVPGMVRAGKNLRAPLTPPTQTGAENFWQVEPDIQLYHFAQGAGRPVLVIHGGPGYPYLKPWAGLEPLAGQYQFNYYDQRGCGQSTRPFDRFASTNYYQNLTTLDQTLGLGAQIADIERIRQILGEEKLIIIGHSFGGFLASLYAAEFPEHVAALILVAPADVLVMPQEQGAGLFEEVRKRLPENRQADYADYLKCYLNFQEVFSKSEADLVALNDEFREYYVLATGLTALPEQGQTGGWMVEAMYFSMGQRHDYRAALKNVSAPVLVLQGADDLQPPARSQLYADAFPNAQLQVIAGGDHFVFEGQAAAFAEAVGNFLAQIP